MPKNLSTLIAALSAKEPERRADAAEQLAQLATDARSAAVALVLACADESEEVRQWATSGLEQLGPPEAADVGQLASLLPARSSDIGYWAATLLGRLQAEAAPAVDALASAVAEHAELAVRQRAAWALGEIGPAAGAAAPTLQKAANDPDARLARLAAESLRKIAG